jgi:hypothetical protein
MQIVRNDHHLRALDFYSIEVYFTFESSLKKPAIPIFNPGRSSLGIFNSPLQDLCPIWSWPSLAVMARDEHFRWHREAL